MAARNPDDSLQATHRRFSRIGQQLAEAERSRGLLWQEVKELRETTAKQKDLIQYYQADKNTRWEFLYWPLRRDEIKSLVIEAPSDPIERKRYRNNVRSALAMTIPGWRVSIKHIRINDKDYFKVEKTREWESLIIQQQGENE